jgi:hypothetical protein
LNLLQRFSSDLTEEIEADDTVFDIPDWTTATHKKKADPNFENI